jgi:hypothetical protein
MQYGARMIAPRTRRFDIATASLTPALLLLAAACTASCSSSGGLTSEDGGLTHGEGGSGVTPGADSGPATSGTKIASGLTNPEIILADATNLYWTENLSPVANPMGPFAVVKMPKTGGTPVTLAKLKADITPAALASDGTTLYWSALVDDLSNYANSGGIMSVPIKGGTVATLVSVPSTEIYAPIAIDDASVYFFTSPQVSLKLSSIPKAGGTAKLLATLSAKTSLNFIVNGVAIEGSDLYVTYTEDATGVVASIPTAGGTPKTLTSGALKSAQLYGCSVDAERVYWLSNYAGSTGTNTALAVPIAGGAVATLGSLPSNEYAGNIGPDALPTNIALDDTNLYWTTAQAIVSLPKKGGTPVTVALNAADAPAPFTIDSTNVYWIEGGKTATTGAIFKAPK